MLTAQLRQFLRDSLYSASITLRANLVKMIFLKWADAIQNQMGKRKASHWECMWDITLGTKRIKVILFFFFLTFMKIEVKKIK